VLEGLKEYVRVLKKMQSRQSRNFTPYKWEKVDPNSEGEQKILYGVCGGCMQSDCATLVYLKNGVVEKIEGNPEAPPNYGTLCAKGKSEILGLYNPYRVKTPLVRTNPDKGLDVDPMWREASWEEALDIVAERLKKIREEDPRSLVVFEGFGNRDTILRRHFVRAFGTPNEIGSHGPLCTVHYASCLVHAGFPVAIVDLEHCQYHITIGRSLGPNFATATGTRKFAKAIERGMKLVVVDPRSSYEASKGEWVPIRPGTDLAFLLAFAHVMLHEGLQFDEWFIRNRTNAPYLIGPDGNYCVDPESQKPLMWDPVEASAKPFDAKFEEVALRGSYAINGIKCRPGFDIICEEFARYTPEWAEGICGVTPETIRRIAGEFVVHARIGSTIVIDGFQFPFRPVSLNTERMVVSHRGGTYADLTGKIINMLVGSIEVPGGCLGDGYRGPLLEPDQDGIVKPAYEAIAQPFKFPPDHIDCREFYPNKHTAPHLTLMAILEPEKYYHDYEVKAWLTVGANPIRKNAQPQKYVEGFKKAGFGVSIAYHMDEPTILADVVLPEHCALERFRVNAFYPQHQSFDDEVTGLHMVQLRQPVPPLFNTKHADDIFMELSERLGILQGKGGLYDHLNNYIDRRIMYDGLNLTGENKLDLDKRYTLEEIFERQLKSWRYNKVGWGLPDLYSCGFLAHRVPRKYFYLYFYFPGNKTRHPFYFERLKRVGDALRENLKKYNLKFPGIANEDHIFDLYRPVPHWVENSECHAPEDYDLWVINWRTPYFSNDVNNSTGNPWLSALSKNDPYDGVVCMNTATAKRKGLHDGQDIVVESRYGKVEGKLRLSELFHPEVVGISGCFGLGTRQSNPQTKRGPHYNSLLPLDNQSIDGVSAGQESAPKVKVYKKG